MNDTSPDKSDKPPLFKSWTSFYVLVICFLATMILLFYAFTKTFA